jgi:hypothetical protein
LLGPALHEEIPGAGEAREEGGVPVSTSTVSPAETALMVHVKSVCGDWIAEAVDKTAYPASLLAALAANETGGDPTRTRFEPAVFGKLAKVIVGHEAGHDANYGSIGALDLLKWCEPAQPPGMAPWKFADSLLALVNESTSWGPTQIMGYEHIAGDFPLSELVQLATHFGHAVNLLDGFRKRWNLPVSVAGIVQLPAAGSTVPSTDGLWAPFFRCWNTGAPGGQTADPQYVPNALARMKIYEGL